MQLVIIEQQEAGQRFDKFLKKKLGQAPGSFLYKMLRKKNIILNGKKATGSELLSPGDEVRLYLSEETILKFSSETPDQSTLMPYQSAYQKWGNLPVAFENDHVVIIEKPAGILTQKAAETDLSLNEWLIGYLLAEHKIQPELLASFRPSVCNRLDRNTSGLVICAKSLRGSQEMSRLLKDRSLHKYYRLFVKGQVAKPRTLGGHLRKDEAKNLVTIREKTGGEREDAEESLIETRIRPIKQYRDITLLEAELITGKTHQIRAHLASIGHPLIGDPKYGDQTVNQCFKKSHQIRFQLLHAWQLTFPDMEPPLEDMSGLTVTASMPGQFEKLMKENENVIL